MEKRYALNLESQAKGCGLVDGFNISFWFQGLMGLGR